MKRASRLLLLVFFSLLFSLNAYAIVAGIEIPEYQKQILFQPGQGFQFSARVFDENNQELDLALQWHVADINGFETTIPGAIDQSGFFEASLTYTGPFKIVVIEPVSQLRDEANLEIRQASYPNQIAYIDIFPKNLSIFPGGSASLIINCYDVYGQRVPSYRFQYRVFDYYGRQVFNVLWIDSPGILHVSSFAPRGLFRVYFEDMDGPATTQITVNIY